MNPDVFFNIPQSVAQKQYEALRMFFLEKKSAKETAEKFGYKYRGFTTIVDNFKKKLKENPSDNLFFKQQKRGPKKSKEKSKITELIINLRKKYYSVEDIKITLDSKGYSLCEKTIYTIIKNDGFARLPRRQKLVKQNIESPFIEAEKSYQLDFSNEHFKSASAGILCLLPYIEQYGIRKAIEKSDYPETSQINKANSILSFIALKASNIRRYSADNLWCMDRGSGLFAGLNVLPKAAWFTSYSHRVTSTMNRDFLKTLHKIWLSENLLSDTANMDFTTIPYWGNCDHLENNWSGKRTKTLPSMLAVLAHDPDSGIINYGDTNVMHKNQNDVVLEFLDFYRSTDYSDSNLKYIVFDSKFTTYENLNKLDKDNIKFITIRRRGKNIVNEIEKLAKSSWKTIRVEAAGNKKRSIKVYEKNTTLKDFDGEIRQVYITGHGKIKPAIIITNDNKLTLEEIVRKYCKRWIVEKTISEQIEFFHLNRVSSSIVVKVDFDLTMSIVTHNIYRLLARDLERYEHATAQTIYEKFIKNEAEIKIAEKTIEIKLKKKRCLPILLENMNKFDDKKYYCFGNKKLQFSGATYS